MTEREILLEAIEIIEGFYHKEGADNPVGYDYVRTYQGLADDIRDFMSEVGYNKNDYV